MPPRRRARATAERDRSAEQAILDATDAIMRDSGIDAMTVAQIIERAQVSRATFYFYFASKYAVLRALFERVLLETIDRFSSAWEDDDPETALRAALGVPLRLYLEHAGVQRAMAESWHLEPELRDVYREMIDRLVDEAARRIESVRGAAGAGGAQVDSRALATALIWMNERCYYLASLGPEGSPHSADELLDAMVAVWRAVVYGSTGGR